MRNWLLLMIMAIVAFPAFGQGELVYPVKTADMLQQLFSLYTRSVPDDARTYQTIKEFDKSLVGQRVYVIESNFEVIGYAAYSLSEARPGEKHESNIDIQHLLVLPEKQRVGFASLLLWGLGIDIEERFGKELQLRLPQATESEEIGAFLKANGFDKQKGTMPVWAGSPPRKMQLPFWSASLDAMYISENIRFTLVSLTGATQKQFRRFRSPSSPKQSPSKVREPLQPPSATPKEAHGLFAGADRVSEELLAGPITVVSPIAYCWALGRWFAK